MTAPVLVSEIILKSYLSSDFIISSILVRIILNLANTIITNTKWDGDKRGEDFWVKAERLLYCAFIALIYYEFPAEEKNFETLLWLINQCETREDDEMFKNRVDFTFERLEQKKGEDHFAVRQYKKYKLAAFKIILRMA